VTLLTIYFCVVHKDFVLLLMSSPASLFLFVLPPRFKVTLISLSMLFMIYNFSLRLLGCPLSFSLSNAFAYFHRQSSCPVSSPSGRVAAVVMQRLTILFRFQLGSNSFCTLFSVHLLVSCATDHPSSHCYSIISF
jgi:hypothetical protein